MDYPGAQGVDPDIIGPPVEGRADDGVVEPCLAHSVGDPRALGGDLLGAVGAGVVVDDDIVALGGELLDDGAADPARRSSNQADRARQN